VLVEDLVADLRHMSAATDAAPPAGSAYLERIDFWWVPLRISGIISVFSPMHEPGGDCSVCGNHDVERYLHADDALAGVPRLDSLWPRARPPKRPADGPADGSAERAPAKRSRPA
jgi:hypothetical protein